MKLNHNQMLLQLYSVKEKGYGKILPDPNDYMFIDLATHYGESDSDTRAQVRMSVKGDNSMLILGFGDRLALLSDRGNNPEYLRLALIAHSIEDFRYDERENIIRLSVINHVSAKLKIDTDKLFTGVAELSSENGRRALLEFNGRSPKMKSISVMKIVETQTPEGVSYRQK